MAEFTKEILDQIIQFCCDSWRAGRPIDDNFFSALKYLATSHATAQSNSVRKNNRNGRVAIPAQSNGVHKNKRDERGTNTARRIVTHTTPRSNQTPPAAAPVTVQHAPAIVPVTMQQIAPMASALSDMPDFEMNNASASQSSSGTYTSASRGAFDADMSASQSSSGDDASASRGTVTNSASATHGTFDADAYASQSSPGDQTLAKNDKPQKKKTSPPVVILNYSCSVPYKGPGVPNCFCGLCTNDSPRNLGFGTDDAKQILYKALYAYRKPYAMWDDTIIFKKEHFFNFFKSHYLLAAAVGDRHATSVNFHATWRSIISHWESQEYCKTVTTGGTKHLGQKPRF